MAAMGGDSRCAAATVLATVAGNLTACGKIAVGRQVVIVRATNPKDQACTECIGRIGTLLRNDGTGRPYQVQFLEGSQQASAQTAQKKLWFWAVDVAPVPKVGETVIIVRAANPKDGACTQRVGQTGKVLRVDGSGRPYQIGFEMQKLWFWPFDVSLDVPPRETKARCYLVPDEKSQKALARLGFDLDAPKSSFDPSKDVQSGRRNVHFGGAHISFLFSKGKVAKLTPQCYRQVQLAAEYCRQRSWKFPKIDLEYRKPQPQLKCSANDLHTQTLYESGQRAVASFGEGGWREVMDQSRFHIGLYSSSLHEQPTPEQAARMAAVLEKAQWGLVVQRDHGGDGRNYFIDWATWEPI